MDVLVSGASMAGLSAAYWFARLGHRVTVVERADGLRPGGAPIDVRGRALGTAERMGILATIDAQKVSIVDPMPVRDGTGRRSRPSTCAGSPTRPTTTSRSRATGSTRSC
jgi:2-polyprenyl-6-methoxyphenol hydroxylase-like FAD-dependent oxidoreductase